MAHRVLEFAPVAWGEMSGLVELDRALGILAEHAVDDTDVEKRACGARVSAHSFGYMVQRVPEQAPPPPLGKTETPVLPPLRQAASSRSSGSPDLDRHPGQDTGHAAR